MSDDYKRRQSALVDERARASNIVIATALVPGRRAPVLLPEATVLGMKPGSVIVDLAAQQGGNCALTVQDASIVSHGVVIMGFTNLPALVPADATALYARNIMSFLSLLLDPTGGQIRIDRSDDIVSATLICTEGAPIRRQEMSPA